MLLWSLAYDQPEHRLTCDSPVLSTLFHDSDPNIIFAGTYSGQIVKWDIRTPSAPVDRSDVLGGHTQPVYSMILRDGVLVTASTDGCICEWLVDDLKSPRINISLK